MVFLLTKFANSLLASGSPFLHCCNFIKYFWRDQRIRLFSTTNSSSDNISRISTTGKWAATTRSLQMGPLSQIGYLFVILKINLAIPKKCIKAFRTPTPESKSISRKKFCTACILSLPTMLPAPGFFNR